MKSGKQRPVKAGSSKRKVPSDVSPSTSLPPLVEGQLRCFLRVTISRLLWTLHKPTSETFVRLRWWGESSNGTHFFPRDGSKLSQKTIKTTALFPIRCGPKQFTSYLTDMGAVVLEVMSKPDHLPIARAQVSGISCLSLTNPVSGFYTLVSPTSEKLGELQVCLCLEALPEAFDSNSPRPTTDVSKDGLQATLRARSLSAGNEQESAASSSGNTPRGKDHLYFKNTVKNKEEPMENQIPSTISKMSINSSSHEPCGQKRNDILSVVLERGNRLRNAMVLSALKGDVDSASALKETPLPLPKDNTLQNSKPSASTSGMFLQNILNDDTLKHSEDAAAALDSGVEHLTDVNSRAVNLLLGSIDTSLPLWDEEKLLYESLSGCSSVCGDSELNDPQYDLSLLENLFYKTPIPDIKPNDAVGGQQKTVSPSEKQFMESECQINEGLISEPLQCVDTGVSPGLSEDEMASLSLIRLARVTVISLSIPSGSTNTALGKTLIKGRPPRALNSNKRTYFVEYLFPLASTSVRRKAGDGELARAVTRKATDRVVNFHHQSVFPVRLSTAAINQWWGTDLIFKIYSRNSDQKKPVLIGQAVHPLRCLLQSKQLSQTVVLPVLTTKGNNEAQEVGSLKVSLKLATHDSGLSSGKSKGKLTHRDALTTQTELDPRRDTSSNDLHVDVSRQELPSVSFEGSRLDDLSLQKETSREPCSRPFLQTRHESDQQMEENPEVLLHTLLMVPDGKNFSCQPTQGPNVYLNCKLFWSDEMARSVVSWGQANPVFNFAQVTPVTLSNMLLERMKNNVMVVEMWQKTGCSGQDRLFGLVKLPLHQFYMSFRDPKITHLLLQSQYPVLGVDCYMPVIDVFSGSFKGSLRVVLAMGSSEQIASMQRMRNEEYDTLAHFVRPVHLLDHQPYSQKKMVAVQNKTMREHLFVIKVDKVNGLTPLQSTVWGETDCYIQYSFPSQEGDPGANMDQNLIETSVNLKSFRTTTTLCVPDPMFGHTETHVLLAPEGVPVQKLLLSCLSCQGLSSGGGIQFEVWCRYYYPNVRDQLVAKGMLPLSKLCAMITLQKKHPDEVEMFSLPLIPRTDSSTGRQPQPSGLLDVCIRYKHRPVRPEGQSGEGAASPIVTLRVQVHRASGLQAAARLVSESDESFNYYASVGVDTYVTLQLSFLPESERRSTRITARTFCPEFDHHTEVSCDLLFQGSSGEICSLAETLEEACAVFTVWHRNSQKDMLIHNPEDVLLGTLKIPLVDLLHKRTGISGWFGVYLPQDKSSAQLQHILVGGLQISLNFTHHSDRERVIKAALDVGWEVPKNEVQDDEDAWRDSSRNMSLTFSMPRAWLPVHCLLLPDHTELQRSTYCYLRYKFYDEDAFCSQMTHPSVEEDGEEEQATVTFQGSRTVELRSSQPLIWYLQEEKLEVQVWVAFKKDKGLRPHDTDRLVGSAFLDLSSFAKTSKQKHALSGVYPLFRRSAVNLRGAALRVHITLTAGSIPVEDSAETDAQVGLDDQEELLSEEVDAAPSTPTIENPQITLKTPDITSVQHTGVSVEDSAEADTQVDLDSQGELFAEEVDAAPSSLRLKNPPITHQTPDITTMKHRGVSMEDSFPVSIAVDQAMHLNLKGCPLAQQSKVSPCCCVSYVTADSSEPVSTTVVAISDSPVWNHQLESRLSKQLLVDPQQSLVFKVWHKGEMERVIGFASVDLSPLLCGFQSVCGWYNITDFSGQCHGQLKVSITPLRGVGDLREQRKTVNEETAAYPPTPVPPPSLSYHTTATYSSFPAHISRYPEQKISSPDRTDRLFSGRGVGESDRHNEHMDKVRLYHQSLQEQTACNSVCSSNTGDISPSSSFLLSTLRKKLHELDNMQRYFSGKLLTPTFPSMGDPGCHAKAEEQSNKHPLLFRSEQLVGKVNSILSGLQEQQLGTIPSAVQSSSATSLLGDNNLQMIPESSSADRDVNVCQDEVLCLPSLLQEVCEDHTDSEPQESKDRQNYKISESADENEDEADREEDSTCSRQDKDADNDDDGDFEEVLVKPRPLNDVTSLTDKTSPWTSILSDLEVGSSESLDSSQEPNLSQGEDEVQTSSEQKHSKQKERDGFSGSARESSDTDGDDKKTLKGCDERRAKQAESHDEGSSDERSSPTTQDDAGTHDASSSPTNQDSQQQLSVPVDVPNFFLPSHQLEETMRAIRLSPCFSQKRRSPGHHRGPRQRRNMSPSSVRKETERIAKIFAARFDEDS
ncbi:C2 domain-containing protein 3 isoform X2 [Antennarius striatus]|uniref:C2 domain-containing protein 3 isoform X2 n=1 Tax=Antennarius striatus TaxID=241820 RepID=UPI0035B1FD87